MSASMADTFLAVQQRRQRAPVMTVQYDAGCGERINATYGGRQYEGISEVYPVICGASVLSFGGRGEALTPWKYPSTTRDQSI